MDVEIAFLNANLEEVYIAVLKAVQIEMPITKHVTVSSNHLVLGMKT